MFLTPKEPSKDPSEQPTQELSKELRKKTLAPITNGTGDLRMFSTTISTPTRIANGTMFTVQALKNVSISALSTHTSTVDDGIIQVYTREGQYTRHTASNEGWTLVFDQLVHQQGGEKLARLVFPGDKRINISTGNSASFYVYTTKNVIYQSRKTWVEGSIVTDDGSLQLFAGIALAYGKWEEGCGAASPQNNGQCLFSPRVFSGVLEYTPLTDTASIIPAIEFRTLNSKSARNSNGNGFMFTIRAKTDIVIQGFNILSRRYAFSNALIYTRSGGFNNTAFGNGDHGFTLLYEGTVPYKRGKGSVLDDFKQNVRISGGETQTFYVFSQKGLMYGNGHELGSAYSEDNSIIIYEGQATKAWFRTPSDESGKWAGTIRYYND